jgi:hypothetical protein
MPKLEDIAKIIHTDSKKVKNCIDCGLPDTVVILNTNQKCTDIDRCKKQQQQGIVRSKRLFSLFKKIDDN